MLKDSIIKDLYYGKLFPHEETIEPTAKYTYESEKASKLCEDLRILLAKSDHEVLEKLLEINCYLSACDGFDRFKQGFVLGAKLMSELYTDDEFKK